MATTKSRRVKPASMMRFAKNRLPGKSRVSKAAAVALAVMTQTMIDEVTEQMIADFNTASRNKKGELKVKSIHFDEKQLATNDDIRILFALR